MEVVAIELRRLRCSDFEKKPMGVQIKSSSISALSLLSSLFGGLLCGLRFCEFGPAVATVELLLLISCAASVLLLLISKTGCDCVFLRRAKVFFRTFHTVRRILLKARRNFMTRKLPYWEVLTRVYED